MINPEEGGMTPPQTCRLLLKSKCGIICQKNWIFINTDIKFSYLKLLKIINPLKTNRRQLYLKTQSVTRCKHFSSRL